MVMVRYGWYWRTNHLGMIRGSQSISCSNRLLLLFLWLWSSKPAGTLRTMWDAPRNDLDPWPADGWDKNDLLGQIGSKQLAGSMHWVRSEWVQSVHPKLYPGYCYWTAFTYGQLHLSTLKWAWESPTFDRCRIETFLARHTAGIRYSLDLLTGVKGRVKQMSLHAASQSCQDHFVFLAEITIILGSE